MILRMLLGLAMIVLGIAVLLRSDFATLSLVAGVLSFLGGSSVIALGVRLLVTGYWRTREFLKEEDTSKQLEDRFEELNSRALKGETLDNIARTFRDLYGIPPTRTLLAGASILLGFLSPWRRA